MNTFICFFVWLAYYDQDIVLLYVAAKKLISFVCHLLTNQTGTL